MQITKDFLTIEEAAARRGCSATTIWRRINQRELDCQRVLGRTVVYAEQVDALDIPEGGGRWRKNKPNLLGVD